MTGRIDSLRSHGIRFDDDEAHRENVIVVEPNGGSLLAFSGYGEFTPISVCSETTIYDANLERDKPRD